MRRLEWRSYSKSFSIVLFGRWLSGWERTGGDKFLACRVDHEVETFQGSRSEQRHVTGLGENDFVDRELLADADDREPNASGNDITVSHDEAKILLLASHADFLEFRTRNPSILTSRVDKGLRYTNALCTMHVILNLATYVECTHAAMLPFLSLVSIFLLPNDLNHFQKWARPFL